MGRIAYRVMVAAVTIGIVAWLYHAGHPWWSLVAAVGLPLITAWIAFMRGAMRYLDSRPGEKMVPSGDWPDHQ